MNGCNIEGQEIIVEKSSNFSLGEYIISKKKNWRKQKRYQRKMKEMPYSICYICGKRGHFSKNCEERQYSRFNRNRRNYRNYSYRYRRQRSKSYSHSRSRSRAKHHKDRSKSKSKSKNQENQIIEQLYYLRYKKIVTSMKTELLKGETKDITSSQK